MLFRLNIWPFPSHGRLGGNRLLPVRPHPDRHGPLMVRVLTDLNQRPRFDVLLEAEPFLGSLISRPRPPVSQLPLGVRTKQSFLEGTQLK